MPQLTIQRAILASFGFTTEDSSVEAYRSIFRNYYVSPTDYDRDVLQSVTYMRENLCLYYTTPELKISEPAQNCSLYGLDGKSQHELFSLIRPTSRFTMLCAFSSSWPPFLARRELLFSLATELDQAQIQVLMIYIQDAHTEKWKIGLDNHPPPQKDFADRVSRANTFQQQYQTPYATLVDGWDNEFSNIYHSWPDRYILLDAKKTILQYSEYGSEGDMDGKVLVDCTTVLAALAKSA